MTELFFADESQWKFVHVLIPISLYINIRNGEPYRYLIVLLILFLAEAAEAAGRYAFPGLAETLDEAIIGDPLMGAAAILPLFFIDQATRFDKAFHDSVTQWQRLLVFVLQLAFVWVPTTLVSDNVNTGVIVFWAIYIVVALAVFAPLAFGGQRGEPALARAARLSVYIWLIDVTLYMPFAAINTDGSVGPFGSLWARMFYMSMLLSLFALGFWIVRH